jgi:hypothetical protein
MKNAGYSLKRVPSRTVSILSTTGGKNDGDVALELGLPCANSPEPEPTSPIKHRVSDATQSTFAPASPYVEVKGPPTSPTSETLSEQASDADGASSSTPKRGRFATAVRSVMMLQTVSPLAAFGVRPQRQRTSSSSMTAGVSEGSGKKPTMDPEPTIRGSRVANLIPKLKTLEATQDLAAHQGLVRHLQFSPNGKFLATSR